MNVNNSPVNINVNNLPPFFENNMPQAKPRIRRTPEEAKHLILESAQRRLVKFGIRGLTVKDIAAETEINHGTLLHHFGSADGMRAALLRKMTRDLIKAMAEILSADPSPEDSVVKLFELMNSTGHIKLLAWRAMEELDQDTVAYLEDASSLEEIVNRITSELSDHDQVRARNMVFLAVSTAVGWGICGDGFQKTFGLSPAQQEEFPHWVGQQMAKLAATD